MRHLPLPSHRPPASPTAALLPRLLLLAALLPALAAPPVAAQAFGFGAPAPLNTNAATDSGIDGWPSVVTDGAGSWVAVWHTGDTLGGTIGGEWDILFARSLDNGTTWSAPAPLNTNASTDSGIDGGAEVATDEAGNWVATWQSEDSLGGTIGTDPDILVARSADNGATWSAPAPLNSSAATDGAEDTSVSLANDGSGTWIAVWEVRYAGGSIGMDYDILVARSTDNGATWTAASPLNSSATIDSGADRFPSLATDGAGNWVATWVSEDSLGGTIGTDGDILVARSTDNGLTWSASAALNANATTDSGWDGNPRIATDSAGLWIAVWHSDDSLSGTIGTDLDILVARSTDSGATWTAPVPLNSNAVSDSGADVYPRITIDGAGQSIAIWHSTDSLGGIIGTDLDILVARSTDAGATWSAPAALNSNAAADSGADYSPQLTTDGAGNWVATWVSDDSLGGTIGTDSDILFATSNSVPVELSGFALD